VFDGQKDRQTVGQTDGWTDYILGLPIFPLDSPLYGTNPQTYLPIQAVAATQNHLQNSEGGDS